MNLQNMMLSEKSQFQKFTYCVIPHTVNNILEMKTYITNRYLPGIK